MTPGNEEPSYEYRTVLVKNYWPRSRQDRRINALAAEGWELLQRSPHGGLFGGSADTVIFRRRVGSGSQRPSTGYARLRAWWGGQGTAARWAWGGVAAVLLISAIASSSFMPDGAADEPAGPSRDQGVSRSLARQICEQEMEDRLRSPTTADFGRPSVSEAGSEVEGYRVEVAGFVDAENAFGATVRIDYECVVRGRGTELRIVDFAAAQR